MTLLALVLRPLAARSLHRGRRRRPLSAAAMASRSQQEEAAAAACGEHPLCAPRRSTPSSSRRSRTWSPPGKGGRHRWRRTSEEAILGRRYRRRPCSGSKQGLQ
ncbi:hypothetical protein EJB05_47992 [Eragrostis curvula]|uniref:Uncharacterized protein n=1 Tax=Eragrostis curvula TaxID=38414 RepID=A0A5J9T0U1_9POAL|nr:hypothetical protein EJB05_47992 [Eragrostis curvula]